MFLRGKFTSGYQVLYRHTEKKGLILPDHDIEALVAGLERINKLFPKEKRTYFDWKVSYLLTNKFN